MLTPRGPARFVGIAVLLGWIWISAGCTPASPSAAPTPTVEPLVEIARHFADTQDLIAARAALAGLSLDDPAAAVTALAHAALGAFYLYTAYGLISYMFEDSFVTKDELFAVGACFTVLLFAFAYIFMSIQEIYPGSFVSFDGQGQRTFLELIYFSGANLTSVGLSDVGAVLPHARAITTIEQLSGVLYVAMVISRLVALTAMRNR